ncbi:MAG: class IIb bacteriocin, lactobin A/cerein 7B family [Firmicutes bacterium]|nr:class IIb bacteriocin, lactobin A/cerein 7B family [Bacillota bacterium]
MKNLNDKELMDVNGGGVSIGAIVGIAAGITFIVGLIDGLFRPLKCN